MTKKLKAFQGIFFDLDGTLVDLHLNWNRVRKDLRARFEAEFSFVMPDIGIHKLISIAQSRGFTNARLVAAEVLENHEVSAEYTPINESIAVFTSMIDDKKVAIISNNLHQTIEQVLYSMNLSGKNIKLIGFDDVRCSKPHPEGILRAKQAMGLSNSQTIKIGDSKADEIAAQKAQVSFCHVNNLIYRR